MSKAGISRTESYGAIVLRQFKKNVPAVVSLWVLVGMFLLATYAPVFALNVPFTTSLSENSPWLRCLFDPEVFPLSVDTFFNVLMATLPVLVLFVLISHGLIRRALVVIWIIGHIAGFLYFEGEKKSLRQTPTDWPATVYEANASAWFPILRHHPADQRTEFNLTPPFQIGKIRKDAPEPPEELWPFYVLGSDNLGNDVLTRVIYGTRIALTIGILAVLLYVTVGIFLGGLAGYLGGWVDDGLMFVAQIFMTIPALFLILFLISLMEKADIFAIMYIIALLNWPGVMRLVRGEFLRQRGIDYVAAGKALGLSNMRIMFRHIAPNSMAPVFVSATFGVAGAILIESTLSFLGLGDPSTATWGQLLKVGAENSTTGRHLVWIAGAAIFVTVLVLNLIGEGLRDALDPKMKK